MARARTKKRNKRRGPARGPSARQREERLVAAEVAIVSGGGVSVDEKRFEGGRVEVIYDRDEQERKLKVEATALDFYIKRKVINGRQYVAGETFSADFVKSGQSPKAIVLQERVDNSPVYEMTESQLHAADRYRKAIVHVSRSAGKIGVTLLIDVCCLDQRAVGVMDGVRPGADPKYTHERLREALDVLVEFYAT